MQDMVNTGYAAELKALKADTGIPVVLAPVGLGWQAVHDILAATQAAASREAAAPAKAPGVPVAAQAAGGSAGLAPAAAAAARPAAVAGAPAQELGASGQAAQPSIASLASYAAISGAQHFSMYDVLCKRRAARAVPHQPVSRKQASPAPAPAAARVGAGARGNASLSSLPVAVAMQWTGGATAGRRLMLTQSSLSEVDMDLPTSQGPRRYLLQKDVLLYTQDNISAVDAVEGKTENPIPATEQPPAAPATAAPAQPRAALAGPPAVARRPQEELPDLAASSLEARPPALAAAALEQPGAYMPAPAPADWPPPVESIILPAMSPSARPSPADASGDGLTCLVLCLSLTAPLFGSKLGRDSVA
jgi:hypothetical protein